MCPYIVYFDAKSAKMLEILSSEMCIMHKMCILCAKNKHESQEWCLARRKGSLARWEGPLAMGKKGSLAGWEAVPGGGREHCLPAHTVTGGSAPQHSIVSMQCSHCDSDSDSELELEHPWLLDDNPRCLCVN